MLTFALWACTVLSVGLLLLLDILYFQGLFRHYPEAETMEEMRAKGYMHLCFWLGHPLVLVMVLAGLESQRDGDTGMVVISCVMMLAFAGISLLLGGVVVGHRIFFDRTRVVQYCLFTHLRQPMVLTWSGMRCTQQDQNGVIKLLGYGKKEEIALSSMHTNLDEFRRILHLMRYVSAEIEDRENARARAQEEEPKADELSQVYQADEGDEETEPEHLELWFSLPDQKPYSRGEKLLWLGGAVCCLAVGVTLGALF